MYIIILALFLNFIACNSRYLLVVYTENMLKFLTPCACNSRCLRVMYILSGFIHYPPFACNSRYLLMGYTHLIFHRLQVAAYNSRYLSVVYTQSHQPSVYNMYENQNIFGFSTRKSTIMPFFLVESPINFKISYIL